ncbi:MAG: GNAT family N-acetyltransferase [Thiobacillus sp.]
MKELAKKFARLIFGEYSAYYVYSRSAGDASLSQQRASATFRVEPVDELTIKETPAPWIREQAGYAGSGSHAYACFNEGRIVGLCFYWFGNRYLQRNFWPLADGEAKLVQIISHPEMRGRGVATILITSSFQDIVQKGFGRAYARIWHSNTPSIRAFERAGWVRIALVLEINPLRRSQPIRIRVNSKVLSRGAGA